MEIIHRLGLRVDAGAQAELARLGIHVTPGVVGFDVSESAGTWPAVQVWIRGRRPSDIVRTKFSDDEIAEAHWLAVRADFQQGFPQPRKDDFGYREANYDLTAYCNVCGVGLRQKAPFQMKGEPNWGRRGILQLNWVYDEYFVKPGVWATVSSRTASASVRSRSLQGGRSRQSCNWSPMDVSASTHRDSWRRHVARAGGSSTYPSLGVRSRH
jgi:hypothetical protein